MIVILKKLEYEKSFEILKRWLENCDKLRKLDFNSDTEVTLKLRCVKYYNPILIKTLKNNKNFYLLVKQKL